MDHLIKIAVTGEGAIDYGKRTNNGWKWGAVKGYIQVIARQSDVEIELVPIERREVDCLRMQRSLRGLRGKAIPARKFYTLARQQLIDNGIYYCDGDRDVGEKNNKSALRKRFNAVYGELKDGLQGNFIPMVAMRMIESWLLGDVQALEKAFAIKLDKDKITKRPEMLWGKKGDPNSNYPKHYLQRIISGEEKDRRNNARLDTDKACQIAGEARTERMRETCELSYGEFYSDFIELLNTSVGGARSFDGRR